LGTDGGFEPALSFPSGGSGTALTDADLDADGVLDLVIANASSLSLLFGNGDGSFGAPRSVPAGRGSLSIVTGDFNADGHIDLASANGGFSGSDDVSVLLGRGDGTFEPARQYPLTGAPASLIAVDLDADGFLDLVTANGGFRGSDDLSLLLGTGDGTFRAAESLSAGDRPNSIVAVDLNLDGRLDLATANDLPSHVISVFFGGEEGSFHPAYNLACHSAHSVVTADFNGDGEPDLTSSGGGGTVLPTPNSLTVFLAERLPPESPDCNANAVPDECDIAGGESVDANRNGKPDECEQRFRRGDCDGDGEVRGVVTDAVYLLNFNFLGGTIPGCLAACDANGDGQVLGVVTDAVYLLTFNFLGGPPPPAPFPECGPGTEADTALGCETPSESCGG
jgi:hypothetical protein